MGLLAGLFNGIITETNTVTSRFFLNEHFVLSDTLSKGPLCCCLFNISTFPSPVGLIGF